ncbi:MAG: ZPR1 zinc finger domain-containing protein [Sulfolobales archaeon]|nr:ZPR1 zinc finger domain-containing protein [Sulfolobales archaeon]
MNSSLRHIGEEVVRCVNCGNHSFKISLYLYGAPLVGNVLIESGTCSKCNYRKSDVSALDSGRFKTIKVFIKSPEDLNALIVKSSTAEIVIPELGVEVYPGPASYGYITTVEGLLERVLDIVPTGCEERKECIDKCNLIKDAMNGLVKFTLIIKDPSGRSTVIGENIVIAKYEEIE